MAEGPAVDVTATAGLYCQIAGVLAGFAFTGLHQYLTRRKAVAAGGGHEREGPVALSLFAALTALTICSLVYAILAGGRPNSGPALTGLIVYGPVFSLAVLAMFHAVVLLLPTENKNLGLVAWGARVIVSIVGPTIVMAIVSVGATYVIYVADCGTACDPWHPLLLSKAVGWLGIVMSATVFLGSIVAFRFSSSFRIKQEDLWAAAPACLVLVVSMLSLFIIFWLATLPPDFRAGGTHLAVIDILAFLVVGAFSVLTVATTAGAPSFSEIYGWLRESDIGVPPAPGDQEEQRVHSISG